MRNRCAGRLRPGQDIVVTRWIAMEAAAGLVQEREEELRRYLPADMLDTVRRLPPADVEREWEIGVQAGAIYHAAGIGIFGALWEMASMSDVGLQTALKKIPVRQEIIEVCEVLGLNPYLLPSGGSLVIGTDHGVRLADTLAAMGIPGAVIGYATGDNDRVVRCGDGKRFLEPIREAGIEI